MISLFDRCHWGLVALDPAATEKVKFMPEKIIRKGTAIFVLLSIIAVTLYIGVKIYKGFDSFKYSFEEILPSTFQMLAEDSALIKSDYLKRIKVVEVHNSRIRGPISRFLVDDKFPLFIYKLDRTGMLSLKDSFAVEYAGSDRTTGVTYHVIDENLFYKFQYKAGRVDNSSSIFLTIRADSLNQTVRSDSLVGFKGLCKNLAIRYNDNAVVDIFIEGKPKFLGTLTVPMEILFYKKNRNTYLLILTANRSNSSIPNNFLQSMLTF